MADTLATIETPDPDIVDQVFTWILEGNSERKIINDFSQYFPDCDPGPIILAAVCKLQESSRTDPDVIQGWAFEATRYVYRKMLETEDYTGALRAVKQMEDLARKSTRGVTNVRTRGEATKGDEGEDNAGQEGLQSQLDERESVG